MENYRKGKNIEEPLDREKIPIPNLPYNFLWMQVRGGSKIRNLLTHSLNELPEVKSVVWTGFGPSVGKAVTCAEIMKKESGHKLHQITKICHRIVEEYWDPLLPELDPIIVKRRLPMIHILLSYEDLNCEELGYQAPGIVIPYKTGEKPPKKAFPNKRQAPTKQMAAMNVDDASKRKNSKPKTGSNSKTKTKQS